MIHPSRAGFREGLAAFQFRNFRLFWFGQLVSLVGTWMQSTAQSWLVLQLSDSPLAVGLVWAFQFTPVTVLSMLGGVFADRRNKRRVLIVTQSLAALQALTLSLLTLTGHITVGWVLGLAAMLGLINAFDVPTRQAFVVELVGRDALMNAIAFNSSAFNAARILGPAVGGVLIASLSAGGVFLINAASYLAVIAGLVLVREAELTARPERVRERIVQSLKAGLDYVRHAPAVLLAIFLVGVVATFGMNFTVLLPVMARDVFNIGAQGFGMLMAAYGVGSVGAGLFLAFRSRLDARRSMLWGGAGVAVLGLAFALSPWLHALPLSVALLFGVGFAAITLTATANTSIQRRVPDALRGRVMAVYITVFSASVPLGSLFAGGLAKGWGAPFSLGAGAVLSGVGVLWAALRLHPAAEADSSPAA